MSATTKALPFGLLLTTSEILSAQPVDDEVPAEPSMAWFHRKAPSTPKAAGGDFDERAEIRNGKLIVDGREPLVHDPTGTIRLTVTHISLTSRVLPTLDLPLHETEEAIREIVAGSVREHSPELRHPRYRDNWARPDRRSERIEARTRHSSRQFGYRVDCRYRRYRRACCRSCGHHRARKPCFSEQRIDRSTCLNVGAVSKS